MVWVESGGSPLLVDAVEVDSGVELQADAQLDTFKVFFAVNEAKALWAASDISAEQGRALQNLDVRIANLHGGMLGYATDNVIYLDNDAAGHGWSTSITDGPLENRLDLLSVVAHEIGHQLGLPDIHGGDSGNVMAGYLSPGTRSTFSEHGNHGHSSVAASSFIGERAAVPLDLRTSVSMFDRSFLRNRKL